MHATTGDTCGIVRTVIERDFSKGLIRTSSLKDRAIDPETKEDTAVPKNHEKSYQRDRDETEIMTIKTKDLINSYAAKIAKGGTRKICPLLGFHGYREDVEHVQLQQKDVPLGLPSSHAFLHESRDGKNYGRNITERSEFADRNDPESFHCAIGYILVLAQCFGVFPVSGVSSPSPMQLVFNKTSARTIYALIICVMMFVVATLAILHMLKTLNADTFGTYGGIGAATAGAAFYGNSFLGAIIFFWLASRWRPLQREWRAMERYVDRWERPLLRWKFSWLTVVILLSALVEHILSICYNLPLYVLHGAENVTFHEFFYIYTVRSHDFVFSSLNYATILGVFLFVVSKFATFIWNFTDLFLMLVSTGLAERYKVLNIRVMRTALNNRTTADWRFIREYYGMLSALVKRVDNDVSPVVLLSFSNNLYFICLQLLNGLSPRDKSLLSTVYFFGSFFFLIGRTVAVTLLAARIHDQSKLALPAMYACPASCYCTETQRLQYQMTTDEIALTGMRFFSITRNFMLAVAGAIVTYEVVLLQFNVAMKK